MAQTHEYKVIEERNKETLETAINNAARNDYILQNVFQVANGNFVAVMSKRV